MRQLIAAITLTLLAGLAGAKAQPFTNHAVTLISPFPPGGSTDAVARIMAERMRAAGGQAVGVEKVGGAGGSIGAGRGGRAPPHRATQEKGTGENHQANAVVY